MAGRVLIIGRSDCLGGEGIQGDVKTVTALGGEATTCITNLTANDADQALDEVELPATFIVRQIEWVMRHAAPDIIKIGRLSSEEQINLVADVIEQALKNFPIIMSPGLMRADGSQVLTVRAVAAWKRRLAFHAELLTASLTEAEILAGMEIGDSETMSHAAAMLATIGCKAVLVTGVFAGEGIVTDVLASDDGIERFDAPLVGKASLAGTKTAISAAIATGLAQGLTLRESVVRARAYVQTAVQVASKSGRNIIDFSHTVASSRGANIEDNT